LPLRKYEINTVFLFSPVLLLKIIQMEPKVSIIMGSISDLPVMEGAAKILNDFKIPFEIIALSAHRTPEEAGEFARNAASRGIKVIIAAAGMAAHLPGVIASMTPVPVIGVPIKASLEGIDSIFSILQMPPGIPVATVGVNAAQNAGILAAQIIASGDETVFEEIIKFREGLKKKVLQANDELKNVKYPYKTN
jgi:5-(carboxyamino)imidazole ribonucleotide mutase